MKIVAKIKKEHIAKGRKECRGRCPIALALLDAGFQRVLVEGGEFIQAGKKYAHEGGGMVYISDYITLDQQQAISSFVADFDESGKEAVSPFKFTLNVPTDVLRNVGFQRPEVAA